MTGLAPYIAAGFAAALAVTTLEFSLAGPASVAGVAHSTVAVSHKGDLLKSPSGGERALIASEVKLIGLDATTIAVLHAATPQSHEEPRALPEGCDPAVSSISPAFLSSFGARCFAAREGDMKIARLLD